jgi:hypothetical protein
VDALHQVLSHITSSSASNYAWSDALTTAVAPVQTTVMLVVEASSADCWVRFKPTSSTAATTVTNGLRVKADQPGRVFYVNPTRHGVLDVIATGAGTVQVQVASCPGARNYI